MIRNLKCAHFHLLPILFSHYVYVVSTLVVYHIFEKGNKTKQNKIGNCFYDFEIMGNFVFHKFFQISYVTDKMRDLFF